MAKKRLSNAETRAFRHKVALLKKAGVVSPKIDARKQKPTRYYQEKVKRLAPVLSGKAQGVKVSPEFLRTFRAAGYAVENRRVIVRPEPGEILKARRGLPEFERVIAPAPIGGGPRIVQRRVILPAGAHNIHDLLEDMRRRPEKWNALKRPDDQFAFKFMGGRSRATFEDIESVADYLEMYEEKFDGDDSGDLWEGLEFLSLGPDEEWYGQEYTDELKARRASARRGWRAERREAGRSWKGDAMRRADKAQNMRDYRKQMSADQREAVRVADRVRKAQARSDLSNVRAEYDRNNQRRRDFRRFGQE